MENNGLEYVEKQVAESFSMPCFRDFDLGALNRLDSRRWMMGCLSLVVSSLPWTPLWSLHCTMMDQPTPMLRTSTEQCCSQLEGGKKEPTLNL